jgi:hypothetical protein
MIRLDDKLYRALVVGAFTILGFTMGVYVIVWAILILSGADTRHLDMLAMFESKVVPLGTFVFGLVLSSERAEVAKPTTPHRDAANDKESKNYVGTTKSGRLEAVTPSLEHNRRRHL